ncbi:MAG: hypothetical protein ACLPT4_15970 [Verrucomicrobiia bacterium]
MNAGQGQADIQDAAKLFQRNHLPIGLLVIGTFVFHLIFGVYYATHAENLPTRTSLHLEGEAFLASFPGWNGDADRDATVYNRAAMATLRTGVPRARTGKFFFHAPVYAYFLAACYWGGGIRLLPVAVAQAVLAGLTCLFVACAAWRIATRQGVLAMIIAALLVFINLRLAMHVGSIGPTPLVLFVMALALFAASSPQTSGRLWLFTLAISLGAYAQAAFFVVAGAAGLWLLWQFIDTRRAVCVVCALVALGAAASRVLLEVSARGPLAEKGTEEAAASILWEANNPYYESMRLGSLWERRPGNPWTRWKMSEQEAARYAAYLERTGHHSTPAALLWIRENPAQYAKLCFVRLCATLGPFTGQMSPRNRVIATVFWLLIFPAGYYGWWRMRHLAISRLALLVFLALTAFEVMVITEWYQRYRLPWDLTLTVYAGVGYACLLSKHTVHAISPRVLE